MAAVDPEQVLHVVADLVCDDVGLREVAGRPESRAELAEEAQIEVHGAVGRAVEGADVGRRRPAAAGRDRIVEEDELGVVVLVVTGCELARPEPLDVVQHEGDEVDELLVGVGDGAGRAGRDADVVETAADPSPPPPRMFPPKSTSAATTSNITRPPPATPPFPVGSGNCIPPPPRPPLLLSSPRMSRRFLLRPFRVNFTHT